MTKEKNNKKNNNNKTNNNNNEYANQAIHNATFLSLPDN